MSIPLACTHRPACFSPAVIMRSTMTLRPAAEHRRTHLSLADFSGTPRGKRRCLGTPAQAELGQDARHVMLDRLARQEQAPGDLGIGQPFTEQGEHLLLTAGEPPDVLRRGPGRLDTEVAH